MPLRRQEKSRAREAAPLPAARSGTPRVLVDHVGMVAEFLNEVELIDVIIELVQNELDAGSSRTEIVIGDDALICSGAGAAMDEKGWDRLGYVLGAGALVEAKTDGIGSKNHGIRACFLLGDLITVQSNRLRVDLTAKGSPQDPDAFYPAGWDRASDTTAPRRGVRIIVPMRRRPVAVPGYSPLAVPSPMTLDRLFDDAVEALPERFLCASTPGKAWRYEILLRRNARDVRLLYAAKPGGAGTFTLRTCRRVRSGGSERLVARRACHPFRFVPGATDAAKVPRLFRDGEDILGELSWTLDALGAPAAGVGTYRYPIALPHEEAGNPFGFDVSGPFVTAKARHALGKDARNAAVLEAAHEAFVAVMRDQLAPTVGAQALCLLPSTAAADAAQLTVLTGALLKAGALPLAAIETRSGRRRHATSQLGTNVLVPRLSYRPDRLDSALAALAPTNVQMLDTATPMSVVTALLAWGRDHGGCELFSEVDAARAITGSQAPALGERDPTWVERCAVVMAMLDLAQASGTLSSRALEELRAAGRLPTHDGRAHAWNEMRWTKVDSLRIPGVDPPPLLHPRLKRAAVLRRGAAAVERFGLDAFLSHLRVDHLDNRDRTAFFRWLRQHHKAVSPTTLAKIASFPIWPALDGTCHSLTSYCVPRKPYLRALIASVLPMPADTVLRFPGLRTASNGALRLRVRLSDAELGRWHRAAMARITVLIATDRAAAVALVDEVEDLLDRLREDDYHPRRFAEQHLSVDASGEVRPIADLHVETLAVAACALLLSDLVRPGRRPLHVALGANVTPLAEAVLRALRQEPDRARLAARLHSYRSADRPLSELGDEPIVCDQGDVLAPNRLAFHLPVDHWGAWKRRISAAEISPDEVRLLELTGVLRGPREESARAFFAWLAQRPAAEIAAHRAQVVRLWLDRRAGPANWWPSFPQLPCLLLRDSRREASLVAPRAAAAARATIYLPDLPALERAILTGHSRLRLAVVDCPGVDGSALDEIARIGVKSLATAVGPPIGLTLVGEARRDPALDREWERARSAKVRAELKTALPRHGVSSTALDRRWRASLAEIQGVQVATGLEAVYEFRRCRYAAPIASGYDPRTRQICVAEASASVVDLFDALAARLFTTGSPSTYAHGLLHAVRALTSTAQASLFEGFDVGGEDERSAPSDIEQRGESDVDGGDNGVDPRKGHGMQDGATPFAPSSKPEPLRKPTSLTFPKGGKRRERTRASSSTDQRRHSLEEEAQIRALKFDHYALHCQACIGLREVNDAAPPESYVYGPGVRRTLIEAHHVRHLANQDRSKEQDEVAGQGAGNLLILCRYHHAVLGDQLSRPIVLSALGSAKKVDRHFPNADGDLAARKGWLAKTALSAAPHHLAMFFTPEHRAAWLAY